MGNQHTNSQNRVYSYEVPNTGIKGKETPHYRNIICKLQNDGNLIRNFDNVSTCHHAFLKAVREFPNNPCIGSRSVGQDGKKGEYKWETYKDVYEKMKNFGAGLRKVGVTEGDKVGIYAPNRPEWITSLQSCYAHTFISVPIYDTLDLEYLSYIIQHAEIKVIICSADKIERLFQIQKLCPSLSCIVSMDDSYHLDRYPPPGGIKVYTMKELINVGKIIPHHFSPPLPSTIASICYTGGVTDEPKGVIISHGNLIASIAACRISDFKIVPEDRYLSYLPMAHMYERMVIETLISCGASIGFYGGDILNLMDDIYTLEPTLFASVPRVLTKIYDKLMETIYLQGGLYQNMFDSAYSSKLYNLKSKEKVTSYIWDQTVFNPLKKKLGGKIRLILSGSAPLNCDIHDFFKITMSCNVLQGYGLTETSACATCQHSGDKQSGNVGIPFPCCEIKLISVPEMGYSVSSEIPKGEICIRGPNVFVGYYREKVKTSCIVDDEGWLHTGDIGQITSDGRLQIIDRKKNIVKLSNGTHISIEELENFILNSEYIHQICILGEFECNIRAIVVPNFDKIKEHFILNGKDHLVSNRTICKDPYVKELILKDIERILQYKNISKIDDIYLENEPFTEENGLITPTSKLKRCEFATRYRSFFFSSKSIDINQIQNPLVNTDLDTIEKDSCSTKITDEINAPEAPIASSLEEDSNLDDQMKRETGLDGIKYVLAAE